jgi:chromosome segregation ATPase
MSDIKESVHDLLIVFLCIAVVMVFVYFQQSKEWNRAIESRDQKISELDQKIAGQQQDLAQAGETTARHKASAENAKNDIQAAMQLIGELESRKQKDDQEIADLKSILKNRDSEIAKIKSDLSAITESTGKDMAAYKARAIELENTVADQTLQLTAARAAVQRLEASEKELQEKLQAADTAIAELNEKHQKALDELAAFQKEN